MPMPPVARDSAVPDAYPSHVADFNASRNSGASQRLTSLIVVEPGLDGVFRHVEGLVGFLLEQEVRVHLAYSSRRSGTAMTNLVERVRNSGGSVVDLHCTNIPEPVDAIALWRLIGLIRKTRPDVIHAHSSKAGALARVAAVLTRHPRCLYTPHAYYGMAKKLTLRVRFFNTLERLLARVGKTIAISRDEAFFAQDALRISPRKITVIHNPVNAQRFTAPTPAERQAARDKLGLPESALVLATIGRMCWQKDPETAYQAVAPLCAQNPDLHFLHLGWGKWKNYLLGYATQLGFYPQLRILDYVDEPLLFYHAADAVLLSSRYEAGWPLVFLEALACDLPVVASLCPGMSDAGQAGLSHAWFFPPEDAPACTDALRRWLDAQRAGLGERNHRRFAMERLTPARCYGSVLNLYRGLDSGTVAPLDPTDHACPAGTL
jgi:glycosyltransferase involved in cell wall biosynthesis